MPSKNFIARLSSGAVASTIAVGCLVPEKHSALVEAPVPSLEIGMQECASVPEAIAHSATGNAVVLSVRESPTEWTKRMEREFRKLALGEAKDTLTSEEMARLEELNSWRERLNNPRSTEEVLLQLKRDRLLEKISNTLQQYVEFQESAGKTGTAAS